MTYSDKNLLPDEQIIHRTKKHVIIFLMPIVWAAAALYCYFNTNPSLVDIAFAPAIVAILTGCHQLIVYVTSDFLVTNKRILMQEGFFFRHTNELRLSTVSNITVNQSLVGRLLNYGTLIINPFGGKNDVFTNVAGPFEFQRQTQIELDKLSKQ